MSPGVSVGFIEPQVCDQVWSAVVVFGPTSLNCVSSHTLHLHTARALSFIVCRASLAHMCGQAKYAEMLAMKREADTSAQDAAANLETSQGRLKELEAQIVRLACLACRACLACSTFV